MHAEHIAMAKMFEDQLVSELNPGLPANWDIHVLKLMTSHPLLKNGNTEKLVTKSLPVTITRIQNMWLLEAYNFQNACEE